MIKVRFFDIRGWRIAWLAVIFALAIAAAFGCSSGDSVGPACHRLEIVADRTGLISQERAEELATRWLASSAPEVTGVEIERVAASCLTTLRSYEQDLRDRSVWTNPDVLRPDMPVWIVEVKGISRPGGIAAANAGNPYRYAMEVINAKNSEAIAGSRYYEPLLESASEERPP